MVSALWKSFEKNQLPHALLFYGPRQQGVEELAGLWARILLCAQPQQQKPCGTCVDCRLTLQHQHPDLQEVVHGLENGERLDIEKVRHITEWITLSPMRAQRKVAFLAIRRSLHVASANALLKILEEPPKHVIFVCAAESLSALPLTVRSRCFKFRIHESIMPVQAETSAGYSEIINLLNDISNITLSEGLEILHRFAPDIVLKTLGCYWYEQVLSAFSRGDFSKIKELLQQYEEWLDFKRSEISLNLDLLWAKTYFKLRELHLGM